MPPYTRTSIIVGICLLALALSLMVGELPSRTISLRTLGLSLQVTINGAWFLGGLLAATVCAGSDSLVRTHPAFLGFNLWYAFTFWPLPALGTFFFVPFLHTFQGILYWGPAVLLYGLLLSAILIAQYSSIPLEAPGRRASRWFLNLAAYALAFALYHALDRLSLSDLSTALAIGLVSGLLALGILRERQDDMPRTWFYALLSGTLMIQVAWALSYWPLDAFYRSLALLGCFYLLTGAIYQHLVGRMTRAAAFEFLALGTLGLGTLWYFVVR